MNETRKPRRRPILCLLLGLALAACSGGGEEPPLKGAAIGGPFTLTDQDGRPATDRDFAGRYRIMYFGFTHCPDVCPTDLAVARPGAAPVREERSGAGGAGGARSSSASIPSATRRRCSRNMSPPSTPAWSA